MSWWRTDIDTSKYGITLRLTWPSRLLLWGLQCVLGVGLWLAYWLDIDASGWIDDVAEVVTEHLKWEEVKEN